MHCADRKRRSLKRRPYETFSEGYVACIGACHDGWDGAASVSENAITDAGPEDDTQGQQTHRGLQWQAQQKQNSQKQNDHSKAWGEAGNALIVAPAGSAAAGAVIGGGTFPSRERRQNRQDQLVRRLTPNERRGGFVKGNARPEGRNGRVRPELFEAFLLLTVHARTRCRGIPAADRNQINQIKSGRVPLKPTPPPKLPN